MEKDPDASKNLHGKGLATDILGNPSKGISLFASQAGIKSWRV